MKKFRKTVISVMCMGMLLLCACGNEPSVEDVTESVLEKVGDAADLIAEAEGETLTLNTEGDGTTDNTVTKEPEGNYIELALNVYFNDKEKGYYSNEEGSSIYVTKEGQYTLSFDISKDLSKDAAEKGIDSLSNLTAIYILDMGVAKGKQSPLSSCNIMYDEILVDGTKLTVTQTEPKSAFKGNGVFDTNDPINAWDGSAVLEVASTDAHEANFTGIDAPKNITVTFTLSGMSWTQTEEPVTETVEETKKLNGAIFSDMDLSKTDSLTLTRLMGNGINLGNTMEAYGHATLGTKASVTSYETYWGEPVTTKEMFVAMKNCGFDSVRIPVAWTNMMDYENGSYEIDKAYLDRVETLVGYALEAEMFVIINDHWDGGWWAMFGSRTPETVEKAWKIYESIWTQVADRFKDYSDMLIFEAANEELGDSLNDNSRCADSGKLTTDDCYALTNQINQKFVDIVRNSGGKNDNRFLMIAGYNTDFNKTLDNRFLIPTDVASGKLLLSVHYYTPWNYCGSDKQARWGLKKEYEEMNSAFKSLEKFTNKGIGVIIGEYGALPINNSGKVELKENTIEYTSNLLNNCELYNYCPMLWSCNDFFIRKSGAMASDELSKLFLERRYEAENRTAEEIKADMAVSMESALSMWADVKSVPTGAPVAWIMWNGGAGTYSVGDTYNPADNTKGIVAHDVITSGPGEYTVSLDFENGNDGLTFAALAVANAETLYNKPVIEITEITVDGKALDLIAEPYTSSDNGICTRVNLYNGWVNSIPDDARNLSGDLTNASAVILDKTELVGIKNITINFVIH